MRFKSKYIFIFVYILFFNCSFVSAKKIHNLISIPEMPHTPLIGYGLVVGLKDTGDKISQVPYTSKTLNNMLIKFGIDVHHLGHTNTKNTASVIVTAMIPTFNHIGQKIDISIASIGNARNLYGGTLLMTILKNIDQKTYAIAQGEIIKKIKKKNKKIDLNKNLIYQKKIVHGAILTRSISHFFNKKNKKLFFLKFKKKKWKETYHIYEKINKNYPNIAVILDNATIQLNIPLNKTLKNKILFKILNININNKKYKKFFHKKKI